MDRKSNKKIRRYVGTYLVFAVLFTIGMYLILAYMTALKQEQMLTMLVKHPELEAEIIALWEKPLDESVLLEEDLSLIHIYCGFNIRIKMHFLRKRSICMRCSQALTERIRLLYTVRQNGR